MISVRCVKVKRKFSFDWYSRYKNFTSLQHEVENDGEAGQSSSLTIEPQRLYQLIESYF